MKALLYYDDQHKAYTDASGQVSVELTTAGLLNPGATLPGRFLLEVGGDVAETFKVTWNATPSSPNSLTATVVGSSIKLVWVIPTTTSGTITYNVYRALSSAGPWSGAGSNKIATGLSALTYTDNAVTAGVTYFYEVSAVNSYGEGSKAGPVSAMVPVTGTVPTITTQPISVAVPVGNEATFVAAVAGTPTPSLNWNNIATGLLAGQTTDTLDFPATLLTNGGQYDLYAWNANGFVSSNVVILFVYGTPTVTYTIDRATNTLVIFYNQAENQPQSNPQWDGLSLVLYLRINSGAWTTPAIVPGSVGKAFAFTPGDIFEFYLVDVVSLGSLVGAPTTSATVTVNTATGPTITLQPQSQTLNVGQAAFFSSAATASSGTLTFQWKKNGTNISGESGTVSPTGYVISPVALSDAANYTILWTDSSGSTLSNPATLTVNAAPVITTQPVGSTTLVEGDAYTLLVTATGGTLTYQWQVSVDNASWANILGSTAATAVLGTTASPVFKALSAWYRVVVSNAAGSTNSSSVSVTIKGIFDFAAGGTWDTYVPATPTSVERITYEVLLNRLAIYENDDALNVIVDFHFFYIGAAWTLQVTVDNVIWLGAGATCSVVLDENSNYFMWGNSGGPHVAGIFSVGLPASSIKRRVDVVLQVLGYFQPTQVRAAFRCMSHPTFTSS